MGCTLADARGRLLAEILETPGQALETEVLELDDPPGSLILLQAPHRCEFAAGLARDLHTHAVAAQRASLQLSSTANSAAMQAVRQVQALAGFLARTASQLAAIGGRRESEIPSVHLNYEIQRTVAAWQSEGRRVHFEPAPGTGRVRMHPREILEVLTYLAPTGTATTIETRREDSMAVIVLTGRAAPGADTAEFFEPYKAGAGLELAAAHAIVTHAGGTIGVANGPDSGVTFRIAIPSEPEAFAGPPIRPLALLLESDDVLRAAIRTQFEDNGWRVIEAPDWDEAQVIARVHPDPFQLFISPPDNRASLAHLLRVQPSMRSLVREPGDTPADLLSRCRENPAPLD